MAALQHSPSSLAKQPNSGSGCGSQRLFPSLGRPGWLASRTQGWRLSKRPWLPVPSRVFESTAEADQVSRTFPVGHFAFYITCHPGSRELEADVSPILTTPFREGGTQVERAGSEALAPHMTGARLSDLFSHVCGLAFCKVLSRTSLGPVPAPRPSWLLGLPLPLTTLPLTCKGTLLSPVCLGVIPFLGRSWNLQLELRDVRVAMSWRASLFRMPVGGVQCLGRSFWIAPSASGTMPCLKLILIMRLEKS